MPGRMTDHIDAEALEAYALGQLEEPEYAATEEHLLICQECRNRLIEARERAAE
jgi:anti-sigma factor ChrR (cupin superfamily)